jgi:hypothetical protein
VVIITVFPEAARPREVVITQTTPGEVILTFAGAEDREYSVVYAESLEAQEWLPLGPAEHLGDGVFSFNDVLPTGVPARYYRLRYP